jgi:flagellar hook-basal body complex protein FliE
MTIYKADAVAGGQVSMAATHPKHMTVDTDSYKRTGHSINSLAKKICADSITGAGTFEQSMLHALDKVSGYQQFTSSLEQQAITDPDSVDAHDITTAQAKARLSLDITRNVLSRLVQGWKDLINTR